MEHRRDELRLATPWSIAELRLDEEDFARLNEWAATLTGPIVNMWSEHDWTWADPPVRPKTPKLACLGLVLLALSSEVARRQATESRLWRFVRAETDGRFRFRADVELFVQGQPSPVFKAALEAAVDQFDLRHATDQDDTKPYYMTILLQFGFGIAGAENWLVKRSVQAAIEILANRQGPQGSRSFGEIWRDLRNASAGLLPYDALRKRLLASPWVLPAWADKLVELAGRARVSSPDTTDDGRLAAILGDPRLIWPSGGKPHFACKVGELEAASLAGSFHTLWVGSKKLGCIEKDGDTWEARPETVPLPGFPSIATVERRDEDSGECEAISIDCFDPRQPVSHFDLGTGRPVEAGSRLNAKRVYALVFADDLTLDPSPEHWSRVECGRLKLIVAELRGDAAASAKLTCVGATVWEAQARSSAPAAPSWATVKLEVDGEWAGHPSIPLGHSYEVAIRHADDVRVAFVRRGMEALEPKAKGPRITHAGSIRSDAAAHAREAVWVIGLERGGDTARVIREFEPRRHGGAILRGDDCDILQPSNSLDARDAGRSDVLVLPPESWDGIDIPKEEWAVMEGGAWVGRPRTRPRPLQKLLGLGGRLTVRRGPFNAIPATPPDGGPKRVDALILADRVVDRGVVRDVQVGESTDDAHAWRIELTHSIEIGDGYEVHWWDRAGEVHYLKPSAWPKCEPTRHDWWSVEPLPLATEPRALVVTYNDKRLGAWWAADWADKLTELAAAADSGHIAELLGRFKLPALEARSLPEVRRFAERFPEAVLRAWLTDGMPAAWRFVVRAAFRDWRPGPDQTNGLASAFRIAEIVPEATVSIRLMEICPILMGRYLRAVAELAAPEDMWRVRALVRQQIETRIRSAVRDKAGTDDTVHDGIRRLTGLDAGFLEGLNKSGIKAVLDILVDDEVDQLPNLDLAVTQFAACRLLLALDILQSLEAGKLAHWKGGTLWNRLTP